MASSHSFSGGRTGLAELTNIPKVLYKHKRRLSKPLNLAITLPKLVHWPGYSMCVDRLILSLEK